MTVNTVALEIIAVENLCPHPKNPRLIMRQDVVDGIKAAILDNGSFSPEYALLVRPVEDAYQIISGHHRVEAARAANCKTIPCWVREMDDDRAEMELVLANNQGELSPLEYGLHALHCVPLGKVGAGRGNKSELNGYAEKLSRDERTLRRWRQSAAVFEGVKNRHIENPAITSDFPTADFIDKHSHLEAIYPAPAESWPALCDFLLTAQDVTVAKISGKAKELAELKKAIPDWWEVDFAALSPSVIADQQYAQRMTSLFLYAAKQADEFSDHTLYRHELTEGQEERNGRDYFKMNPVSYEYSAKAEFKKLIAECGTIPKIDQLREMTRMIELHIKAHSDNSVKWVPVLTDSEQEELDNQRLVELSREAKQKSISTLHHGDCVRGMRTYSGPKFDLLLTDPPYGMAFQSNRRTAKDKESKGIDGDDSIDNAIKLFDEVISASIPNLSEDAHLIVFCCDEHEPRFRKSLEEKGLNFKRLLVWVKPNHGSGDLQGGFAPRKELALHFVKGSPSLSPRVDDVFIQEKGEFVTDHPTEKPVSMLKTWINSTTQPGDWVLDPFMGTGATMVAAKQLGRNYRGFELEEHYYGQAIERIIAEAK